MKTTMPMFLAGAAAIAILTGAGTASAATLPLDGSYTVSYTATTGNGPSFSEPSSNAVGTFNSSNDKGSFSKTLTLNSLTSDMNFFTVSPSGNCGYCGMSDTATGTIAVTFSFTEPSGAIGSVVADATYTADYKNDTDSVVWTSGTPINSTTQQIVVDFTDGAFLDIDLIDASDWSITPQISFDLDPTTTPLPAGLPLFVGGLGVLGFAGWRRKRAAKTNAAA